MKPGVWFASAALGAATLVATTSITAHEAEAQNTARLDLEAQTLFVDENPAEIAIRVSSAPETAKLRFTVYDTPVLTREEVRDHHTTPPAGGRRIANFECTLDGDCRDQADMTVGPDGIITVTLNDEDIGEFLRSERGILPFVVRLLDTDDNGTDTVLDDVVTSLIVLGDDREGQSPSEVAVGFLAHVIAPLALQADGRTVVDSAAVVQAAAPLAANPDLAVTIEIRPETIGALAATDPAALEELLETIGGRPLLRGPWVDMDEEAWRRADESDQVVSQYARGNDTFEEIAGVPPTGLVLLDPDANSDTLTLLRSAGATTLVVDDDQLSPETRQAAATQPFQLLDANGVAATALRFDEALHETLDDEDPELGAYRAIAELTALAQESSTDQGVLLDLDRLGSEALVRLLEGIDDRSELRVAHVTELAEGELATRAGERLRGDLVSTPPPDLSALAERLETATAGVATLARMFEPELELITPLVDRLQAAVSADLTLAEADEYVSQIDAEIESSSSGIEIPDGARVTLTDRRTDLPLMIVNRQPLPVNVELLLTAEKLRFPDGDRLSLTLGPGDNLLTIPVETLASGDARVTATVVSPGGFFELGTGTVDIRSTAISGLGLVISVVALAVLAMWWIRTVLRVRRNRAAATVSAESAHAPSDHHAPTTEGEP